MNTETAAFMITVIRKPEVNRGSTTALVIGNHATLGRARSRVLAGRAIGHVVDDVQISRLGSRHMQVGDGEATMLLAARQPRARGALPFVRSTLDAFSLERKKK